MTDTEFAKLKLIRAINPEIDPDELERYFCAYCSNFDCRSNIDTMMRKRKVEEFIRFRFSYIEGRTLQRIVDIYKCFEGEEK